MWNSEFVILIFALTAFSVFASSLPANTIQNGRMVGPKIINGTVARLEDTKHQVSVRLKNLDWFFGAGHICGGSLISPNMVLTAAHCIYNYRHNVMRDPSEFKVTMGSTFRYDERNNTSFEILDIFYKDTFNVTTFVDDIAIMILDGSVPEEHETIRTISINWADVPDDTVCQVTGWGITELDVTSDVLISLDVPIINHTLCAINYEGYVREGMICAGYMEGLKDACSGDSGGPLVCHGKLTGIVSFGAECAKPNYPGVYTEVKFHEDWIREFIGSAADQVKSSILFGFSMFLLSITHFFNLHNI